MDTNEKDYIESEEKWKMQQWLWNYQMESKCNRLLQIAPRWGGLGADMWRVVTSMVSSFESNRTISLQRGSLSQYAHVSLCPKQTFDCFFNQFTICPSFVSKLNTSEDKYDIFRPDSPVITKPTTKFGKTKRGLLWYYAQVLHFVWQPLPEVMEVVMDIRKKIKWQHPLICLHIRHGDGYTENKLHPIEGFINGITKLQKHFNKTKGQHVNRIFLATDDPEVIEVMKNSTSYDVIYNEEPRKNIRGSQLVEQYKHLGHLPTIQVIANMIMMSDCDGWVGTFRSNFAKLPFLLSYAKYGYVMPHHSVHDDKGWPGLSFDTRELNW
eukprot:CAMPEP_0168536836 /NCGR_PEP_ID=MMETSP0405-20121227/19861_1 /TAXON_ID=498012 /ORGANISM="Trichosphaerium sp, Strain Am-I-7 wt" /LENGTH=323 /DNA_ID=CAMNT_0008565067 /DNA_START=599 /DNA_END=1568 /DNA_ORIENTATION=+